VQKNQTNSTQNHLKGQV